MIYFYSLPCCLISIFTVTVNRASACFMIHEFINALLFYDFHYQYTLKRSDELLCEPLY